MKAALYARVSTHDQQTLPLQLKAMRAYARKRKLTIAKEVKEIGSSAKQRPQQITDRPQAQDQPRVGDSPAR